MTGIDFPSSGIIQYKFATYPDQFGDYTSISLVKLDKPFNNNLINQLQRRGFKETGEEDIGLIDFDRIKAELRNKTIDKEYSLSKSGGLVYSIGFLSDKETVIVQRLSW